MTVKLTPAVQNLLPSLGVFALEIHDVSMLAMVERGEPELDIHRTGEINDWRETYRKMGLNASDHRSSIEALLRRPASYTGIRFVDLCNSVSIHCKATIGAYDRRQVDTLTVRLSLAEDRFDAIGRPIQIKPGVPSYCDDLGIVCYGLNHRDSQRTAIRTDTRHALVISEYVSQRTRVASIRAMTAIQALCSASKATCTAIMPWHEWDETV